MIDVDQRILYDNDAHVDDEDITCVKCTIYAHLYFSLVITILCSLFALDSTFIRSYYLYYRLIRAILITLYLYLCSTFILMVQSKELGLYLMNDNPNSISESSSSPPPPPSSPSSTSSSSSSTSASSLNRSINSDNNEPVELFNNKLIENKLTSSNKLNISHKNVISELSSYSLRSSSSTTSSSSSTSNSFPPLFLSSSLSSKASSKRSSLSSLLSSSQSSSKFSSKLLSPLLLLPSSSSLFSSRRPIISRIASSKRLFTTNLSPGPLRRLVLFFSRCAGGAMVILGNKIAISHDKRQNNLYGEMWIQVIPIGDKLAKHSDKGLVSKAIRIQSKYWRSFVCYNKKGRLITKVNGDDVGCLFSEIHLENGRYEYKSFYNTDWFIGFNKRGKPIKSTIGKPKRICTQFTKRVLKHRIRYENHKDLKKK